MRELKIRRLTIRWCWALTFPWQASPWCCFSKSQSGWMLCIGPLELLRRRK